MRPSILLILLTLATAHCLHRAKPNSQELLEQASSEQHQDQELIYIQGRQPTRTTKRSSAEEPNETTFFLLMPWVYLLSNNMITTYYIHDNYPKEKYCFTFSIILIIAQVHIGLLQMLASKTICYYLRLKIIYIVLLVIINTLALTRIFFSRKLKWKQLSILFAYFSIMVATGMFDRELYQYIQESLLVFCPIIHLYDLKNKRKAIDYTTIPTVEFICYNMSMFFFTSLLLFRPDVFIKPHTLEEIGFFIHFDQLITSSYFCLMLVPKFRDFWTLVSRWIKNRTKLMMGMKLEEETCVICLQKMDHFAHLYQRINTIWFHYESDVYEADCGHLFHRKCITAWGNIRRNCPIDNSAIVL